MNPAPPSGNTDPIDEKVRRRTLGIVLGAFILGFILAGFWMSREILRVKRIHDTPVDDSVPGASAPARPGAAPTKP